MDEDSIAPSAPPGSTSIDTPESTAQNVSWLTNDARRELERNSTRDRVLKLKQEASQKARLKALYMQRTLDTTESTDGNQLGIKSRPEGQMCNQAEFDQLKAKYPEDAQKLKEQEQHYKREAAFEKKLTEKAKVLECTVDELRERLEEIVSAAKNNK